MEGAKKRGRSSWLVLAGLGVPMLLLALYVGAYYATVTPVEGMHNDVIPRFSIGRRRMGTQAWRFFGPIHELDRRLRPHVWTLPP